MAANMYLKLEGVEGESESASNPGEFEILSWSHSFTQPTSPTRVSAGAGTVEKAHHSDLTFTKYMDKGTPPVLKACWNGKQMEKATLTCYRSDGAEDGQPLKYLTIEMDEVVISNVSVSGGAGDIPIENISLNYGKVSYNYMPQNKGSGQGEGNSAATHDLKTNSIS